MSASINEVIYLARSGADFARHNPMCFFKQNPAQVRATRSKAKTRLLFWPNRAGKTTWGVMEDIAHMVGRRPWLSADDPDYYTPFQPPVKGRIICADFSTAAEENIIPEFERWFPGMAAGKHPDVKCSRHQCGTIDYIKHLPTESEIHIMTHRQEKQMEGGKSHFLHIDEPCSRASWLACRRGLTDTNGDAWFTMTPVKDKPETAKHIAWIYMDLFKKAPGEKLEYDLPPNLSICKRCDEPILKGEYIKQVKIEGFDFNYVYHAACDMEVIEASIYDNIGFGITEEAAAKWISDCPESERPARIFGKFSHLEGRIYEGPNENRKFDIGERKTYTNFKRECYEWPVYIGIDVHPSKGQFAVFHTVPPEDYCLKRDLDPEHVHAYGLCWALKVKEFAKKLIAAEPMVADPEKCMNVRIIAEAAYAEQDNMFDDKTFVSEMQIHGVLSPIYACAHGPGSLENGIIVVRNYQEGGHVSYGVHTKPLTEEMDYYIYGPNGKPQGPHDFLDAHRMVLMEHPVFWGHQTLKEEYQKQSRVENLHRIVANAAAG